jgi:hypothetical protein
MIQYSVPEAIYLPPNEEIEMEHHYMNSETPTVNILDCIKWLTDDFTLDQEEMQYNRLIDDLMDELRVISESDATIDLLDKETWVSMISHVHTT